MNFINVVVHCPEDMNLRVHLQYEFTLLGLDDYLQVGWGGGGGVACQPFFKFERWFITCKKYVCNSLFSFFLNEINVFAPLYLFIV